MTKLEQLIGELCPNGVEYKTLGDIATDFFRGSGIKREDVTAEGIPCVRYGEIYTTYGIWFDECVSHTTLDKVASPKFFEYGDILFVITGESVEDIAKSTAYIGHMKCLAGGDIVVMRHKENPKYISYVLSTTAAQKQKSAGRVKSKVVHSNVPSIKAIRIPVPPIEVQAEIVKILDNFTELTAELTARQKQYEYYRDLLLTFSDVDDSQNVYVERERERRSRAVRWLTLNDVILSLNTGLNPRQFFRLNTDDAENYYITIREIHGGRIVPSEKTDRINDEALCLCNNRSNLEVGDVLFSGTGTIGETAVITEEPSNWNIKEGVYTIKPDQTRIVPQFLRYLLTSEQMKTAYMKKVAGGTVKSIPMAEMRKLLIPVPSIDEQKRIVLLLSRFDTLCNDLKEGLPAEIEARQRQYEYYRDRLLTFKEAV